jgi:hypothetical protein
MQTTTTATTTTTTTALPKLDQGEGVAQAAKLPTKPSKAAQVVAVIEGMNEPVMMLMMILIKTIVRMAMRTIQDTPKFLWKVYGPPSRDPFLTVLF